MSAKFFTAAALIVAAILSCAPAQAQQRFAYNSPAAPQYAPMAQEDAADEAQIDPRLARQTVTYSTSEAPGTVVIDTPNTYLYFVLGNGQAIRYGIGVGREGFTWAGVKQVARKAEWPDWYPPQSMIARQPYLPRFTAGGPGNPLGARAMYLGSSEYRIHGTNNPATIGKQVSSGCIRLTNEDVTDLYNRVQLGAKVVVLPMTQHAHVAQAHPVTTSYAQAPQSNAQRTWASIRPSSIY
ncbi:MAG: L,D-transpeptidase [Pseudolabrys sp.]|nr:L,D-transpeptidase [Pseudolabrys sp.]MSP31997.1 L,D-transpeptidase [Pseudolabrys sp.]